MYDVENVSGIDLSADSGSGHYAVVVASESDAILGSTLDTIHNDLQLMHFSMLAMFCIVFVAFCVKKWR